MYLPLCQTKCVYLLNYNFKYPTMKKFILPLLLSLVFTQVSAQKKGNGNKVPAAVKAAFKSQFPSETVIKWEKKKGMFEADYISGGNDRSVTFDAAGNVKFTEMEIPVSELPLAARDLIVHRYKKKKIKSASRITDASGIVTYEVDIAGKDLIFDAQGKYLRIEKDKGK